MPFVFIFLLLLSGCFQVQNSFEQDGEVYAYQPPLDLTDPAQVRLQAARNVFLKYSCVECHAGRGGAAFNGFTSFTDAQWKATYWGVTPGSTANSRMFSRLRWSGCNTGDCNMPNFGAQMTDEDVAVIRTWIEGMSP